MSGERRFRLALLQMRIEPGEASANLARAIRLVQQAAREGAEIVLLPEALPFGWMDPAAKQAGPIPDGAEFVALREAAARNRVHLCAGLVENSGGVIYNSAVLISPEGELLLRHRKINELEIAHDCYALGDRLGVAETPFGRIGLMICADAFARGQVIARALAMMGARVILSPCAWAVPPDHDPSAEPYGRLWLDNYGPVARDFRIWIAGCSNVGPIRAGPWRGHRCIGCSLVVGPEGTPRLHGRYGESAEEILHVEITPEKAPARGTGWENVWTGSSLP